MTSDTPRPHGRRADALRPVRLELDPLKFAEGSASIVMGDTRVLVAATVENRVPPFLVGSGGGWATAEYAMLPRATSTRNQRERGRGPKGRTAEIQRLIGRSLRAALDFPAMGERTLILDCDVVQADGGTRTAAITGAWVATVQALGKLYLTGDLPAWPVLEQVAAVSVGLVDGRPLLDLEAIEDQAADVDLNVVATGGRRLVEVQGTGERTTFSREQLDGLLDLAFTGLDELMEAQRLAVAATMEEVEAFAGRGRKAPVEPKSEKDLWGRP